MSFTIYIKGMCIFTENKGFMQLSPRKLNVFLAWRLPAAFWCGVRVKTISETACVATVTHRWINQNPFQSMYFAVQGMAAELTTGALVMAEIQRKKKPISMLVLNNKATYTKKATGKITFTCQQGAAIAAILNEVVNSGGGQTIWLQSIGVDELGEVVSVMDFEWTLKLKSKS